MRLTIHFKSLLSILLTIFLLGVLGWEIPKGEPSSLEIEKKTKEGVSIFEGVGGGMIGRLEAQENRSNSDNSEGNVRRVLSQDGQTEAEADLIPSNPRLSETLTLTIRVICPPKYSVTFPEFGERYGDFLIESAEGEPTAMMEGRQESAFRLSLIPTKKGECLLLPIPVTLKTPESEKSVSLLIPAGRVTIESDLNSEDVSLTQLNGSRGLIASPYPWFWRGIALLAAVLLALILLRYRSVWKRRQEEQTVSLSPSERALKRLEELKASRIHLTDVRQFYLSLTEIVRQFIEEVTGIRAPEQTTEEFLRAVEIDSQKSFDDAFRRELARFLEFSDLVKFAKFHPAPEEIDLGYQRAEEVARYSFSPSEPVKSEEIWTKENSLGNQ